MNERQKPFDAVDMMRTIRDRLSADIAGMTLEEELAWLAATDLKDPFLLRLRARTAQRADAADDAIRRSGSG
jgi:hypothetical protein